MAFVVLLRCNKLVALKAEWVYNPVVFGLSTVFFSPNGDENARFGPESKYFFTGNESGCFYGYVYKDFGKIIQ